MKERKKTISRILEIPYVEPEKMRRGKLLNVMLLAAAVSAVVMIIVLIITAPMGLVGGEGQVFLLALSTGVTLVGLGIIYTINRFVSGELASVLFLVLLLAVAAFSDKPEQVVNGRGLLVFVIPILAASFLLRPWASFAAAAVSSLMIVVMGLVFFQQSFPNVPAMLIFFMLALVSWISARSLENALHNLRTSNARVQESEEKLRSIFESSPDAITVSDLKGNIINCNQAALDLLGYEDRREVIGENANSLIEGEGKQKVFDKIEETIRVGVTKNEEYNLFKKDGSRVPVEVSAGVIRDAEGDVTAFVAIAKDITERKKAEKQIKRELQEKTVLLSEIHHRVKNSLQIVASLLNLQSREIEDKRILDLFNQSRNRIKMMASVYEKLCRSKTFTSIDFKEYLEDVLKNIFLSSGLSHRVNLKLDVENVELGLDDAIPVALILNELFTNSVKHAFPGNTKGLIEVYFKPLDEETHQLIYRDNGVGLPEDIDLDRAETLGLHLIKNLADQIEGEATFRQNGWTTFKIQFKGYGYAQKKYSHR
ncbi:PAS domain S-box protein [bacterium]|nr:PAS domain S-box protein [bacterium]